MFRAALPGFRLVLSSAISLVIIPACSTSVVVHRVVSITETPRDSQDGTAMVFILLWLGLRIGLTAELHAPVAVHSAILQENPSSSFYNMAPQP